MWGYVCSDQNTDLHISCYLGKILVFFSESQLVFRILGFFMPNYFTLLWLNIGDQIQFTWDFV